MKKSDKKIDNALREALTKVCDQMLYEVDGFVWLTHLEDFDNFPKSLKIVCVFKQDDDLKQASKAKQDEHFYRLINDELINANIAIKNSRQYVSFDTEEACIRSHQGNWSERIKRLTLH